MFRTKIQTYSIAKEVNTGPVQQRRRVMSCRTNRRRRSITVAPKHDKVYRSATHRYIRAQQLH